MKFVILKKLNTILFIDDDEATNYYHRYIIDQMGCCENYEIFQRSDEALHYLTTQCQVGKPPELVFLDLNMPKMDGWTFLKACEKLELRGNAIVILTSSTNPKDRRMAEEHPLVFAIETKPLLKTRVMELVESIHTTTSSTDKNHVESI